MSDRNDPGGGITLGLTLLVCVGAVGFAVVALKLGERFAIPVGIVALVAAAVIFRGPLGQALAHRLEGGSVRQVDQDAMVHSLDEMRARMAELEERVDFAERLLAQSREPDRVRE